MLDGDIDVKATLMTEVGMMHNSPNKNRTME